MTDYGIVVLDIGKTNKKLFVYDSDFVCLNPGEKGVVFGQVEVDGILSDDMASVYEWMIEGLRKAARDYEDIRCVSITTHGATIALLSNGAGTVFDGDGGLVFPIVSYEQEITPADDEAFYRRVGAGPDELQRRTGTARFGWLLNHAKQISWLQEHYPKRFEKVTDILMFPQYLAFLLTGKKAAEPTYLGCHGYLLDISGDKYSSVADSLGVTDKLPPPPFKKSWEAVGTITPEIARKTGLPPSTVVTTGVHDSNAALVPYFAEGLRDFVVQDSGTWVVTMSPRAEARFDADELGREVFFNRSIYGGPVKTTIFRGGAEFDFYRHKVLPAWPHPETVDLDVLGDVLTARQAFALPTVERGSGLFPESVARLEGLDAIFRDAAYAWCVVDLSLAIQGYQAIRMAGGDAVERIFIEGNVGRGNPLYRGVIAALFPGAEVFFGTAGGAAYGAAILGGAAVEAKRPEELTGRCRLELERVRGFDLDAELLGRYVDAFMERVRART